MASIVKEYDISFLFKNNTNPFELVKKMNSSLFFIGAEKIEVNNLPPTRMSSI